MKYFLLTIKIYIYTDETADHESVGLLKMISE
jgi:hypothetical protein